MKYGKTLVATMAALAAVSLAGCSSGDDLKPPPPLSATAAADQADSTSANKAPTAAQLEAMLNRAIDPDVPSKEKIDLVQGATAADAPMFDELVKIRKDNPKFTWQLGTPKLATPGQATATVSAMVNGQNQSADVTFVFDDGKWKLQRTYACGMLQQLGRSTPSCG
ncbi:hypothetical protein P0W64_16890 [Tsukamurella sp. 8F]|uniref:hypothetical protein n=1 Tax=unclassified Tsukamurella TaxID=2633480 RepID=UPI0023B90C27|nr:MULTISPECIES: hypothetical protein [unclassified Tsukamurella]MDF0532449.1 hypothetical protein [Tsukamurella sp. 8J]MDF0588460.1 hypothetical protein [Tsukamurella sp. 8F]